MNIYAYAQSAFGQMQICTDFYASKEELQAAHGQQIKGLELVEVKPDDPDYNNRCEIFGIKEK